MKSLLNKLKKLKTWQKVVLTIVVFLVIWQIISGVLVNSLMTTYQNQESQILYDRNGKLISIQQNQKSYYNQFLQKPPKEAEQLLLKKEDRFFYWHFGLNPFSIARDVWQKLINGKRTGSSTLSQQLVKNLLGNEQDRGVWNKTKEMFYTLALEWRKPKKEILTMYFNTAYFGGQSQGFAEASWHYFGKPPENLSTAQTLSLLSTLNNPSQSQVGTELNLKRAKSLANDFKLSIGDNDWNDLGIIKKDTHRTSDTAFEISDLNFSCQNNCVLTIDKQLTENIREILNRNLQRPDLETASTGAVVVIKMPENEVLAIVGSPDISSQNFGHQVNMAIEPRAVGSTAKPFIYLKAFEKGARPYTLVSDQEVKYLLGTGFDFFPKNFDGQFRGTVSLKEALSNSLNVPTVQTLSFVGLPDFYKFIKNDLHFKPAQPLENYELGIALGGFESDLLTWSDYFTLFGQQGFLKPLTIIKSGSQTSVYLKNPMSENFNTAQIGGKAYVELVNKILSDRDSGVAQFGIKSNLNLPYTNYALKTGTSRDYHDSWTMGYSPDFLVGVWVGNSNDKPMREVTGLSGAARIWNEVMQNMYNSSYNKNTPFNFGDVAEFEKSDGIEYGLKTDNYDVLKNLILQPSLMFSPHNDDKYLLLKNTTIPFEAIKEVSWYINDKLLGKAQKINWQPKEAGEYKVKAVTDDGKKETVTIQINLEDK